MDQSSKSLNGLGACLLACNVCTQDFYRGGIRVISSSKKFLHLSTAAADQEDAEAEEEDGLKTLYCLWTS